MAPDEPKSTAELTETLAAPAGSGATAGAEEPPARPAAQPPPPDTPAEHVPAAKPEPDGRPPVAANPTDVPDPSAQAGIPGPPDGRKVQVELRWAEAEKREPSQGSLRTNFKELGPVLTGIASASIAALVFFYGKQFNARQAAAQQAQVEVAQRELRMAIINEFSRSVADLSAPEERTRTLAAIKMVHYKEEALHAMKPALGVADDDIRRGAVTVVEQLFRSEVVGRGAIITGLLQDFNTQNAYLRRGVLECFARLGNSLDPGEVSQIMAVLNEKLPADGDCSKQEDQEVLNAAGGLLGMWPSADSARLLLRILANKSCLRPRIQSVDSLINVGEKKPEERPRIIEGLRAVQGDPEAPDLLRQNAGKAVQRLEGAGGP